MYPRHVVYANGEVKPSMVAIDQTQALHSVKSDGRTVHPSNPTKKWLIIADYPCICSPCRGLGEANEICKFAELWNERENWAKEKDKHEHPLHLLATDE